MTKKNLISSKTLPLKNKQLPVISKPKHDSLPVVIDPLKHYLMEVNKFPILSEKEEIRLAKLYHKTGDVEAARMLVNSHLRLVAKIAFEYRSAYHNILDLIQEGNIGLLQAVKNFKLDKGSRLAHYATWWIKSFILKFILDNFRLIKIGTTKAQKRLFYNLMQEKERIESQGFKATPEVLSQKFDTTPELINEMEGRLSQPELALDSPVSKNHEVLLKDFLSDNNKPIDEQLSDAESSDMLKKSLEEFSKNLNERELKIFRDRLVAEIPKTLQDIADEYGITKERVRQVEERILKKLKEFFEDKGIKVDLMPNA